MYISTTILTCFGTHVYSDGNLRKGATHLKKCFFGLDAQLQKLAGVKQKGFKDRLLMDPLWIS